jgi:hypothetical protein
MSNNSNGLTALPTAAGGIARAAYARCVKERIDTDMLLRKVGLTRQQIDDPKVRLTVQSQIKFLDLAAEALGDEFLGFHLAEELELRELGLLFYVMRINRFNRAPDLLGVAGEATPPWCAAGRSLVATLPTYYLWEPRCGADLTWT